MNCVFFLAFFLVSKMTTASFQSEDSDDTWPIRDEEGYVLSYTSNDRWVNYWSRNKPGTLSAIHLLSEPDNSNIPRSESLLNETLPIIKPYWLTDNLDAESECEATWLGHSTLWVRVDDIRLLTDPIFSAYSSPVQGIGFRRYRNNPCTIPQLPDNLDGVLISHSHYDHLDMNSVRILRDKYGPDLHWFVPQGLGPWLASMDIRTNVHESVWWQEHILKQSRIVFTPANHWTRRGIFDENKVLWGSWTVIGPKHKFHFAGDTAYQPELFKQINRKFGAMDLSTIPIGAYQPRWFMKWLHVNPDEAVLIHKDLQSRKSLGIHWGTFKLTREYYLEPKNRLAEVLTKEEMDPASFVTTDIGGTVHAKPII